jgi:hypothetical protein
MASPGKTVEITHCLIIEVVVPDIVELGESPAE